MDLKKIFIKNACPTKIGGQAVMEGIMMRGAERLAVVVRLPNGKMHIKTEGLAKPSPILKLPIIRGVVAFISSLIQGTKILMYSADVLEAYETQIGESAGEEKDKLTLWLEKHFGEKGAWNVIIYASVILSILFTVFVFILLPTALVNFLGRFVTSNVLLNLVEGILRICMFIIYVVLISKMNEIKRVFQYHGAEHKTIHCLENGLDLTPENADSFYTLHPRCGTSFLMFVMIISLILFSLMGWPNLLVRVLSRLILLPVVAGLSYELLKWAGRSDSIVVKVLSMPGILLQKLTTREPDKSQLEVAIAAIKAVTVDPDTPYIEGICDLEGKLIPGEEGLNLGA